MACFSTRCIFCIIIIGSFVVIQAAKYLGDDSGLPPRSRPAQYNALLDYVFNASRYNPVSRPVQYVENVTDVIHQFAIQQIINIDVKQEQMTVLFWQRMRWVDGTISWDPASFGNITHFTISPDHIWTPDIVVYNRVSNFDGAKQASIPLMVFYNGRIQWNQPLLLISTCNIHIRHFPYDKQRCEIKIGSWIHSANEITIKNVKGSMDENYFILNGEWILDGTRAVNNRARYSNTEYTDVNYSVFLQRRPKFYEKNIVIPTALISLLATLVFLLPPESGEKIGLSITVFLALCVNLLLVAEMMPATSLETPIIGEYYLISISMVAMSLVATVVVLNVHNPHSNAAKPPRILTFIFFKCIARIVFMSRRNKTPVSGLKTNLESRSIREIYTAVPTSNSHEFLNGNYRDVCKDLRDGYCPRAQEFTPKVRSQIPQTNPNLEGVYVPPTERNFNRIEKDCQVLRNSEAQKRARPTWVIDPAGESAKKSDSENHGELRWAFVAFEKLMHRMEVLIGNAADKVDSEREEVLEEWHFLARVLDRLFAITSFIIIVAATVFLIREAKSGTDEVPDY